MKILYVEDEIAHVELTQRTLEDNLQDSFVLFHAESLRDALKMLDTEPDIDLVLTDLRLPDGSGLDLLKKVKEFPSPPAVVLVTGQGDQEIAVTALKAGAADYLVKQSDYLHRLPVVISNAVAQNRLAREQAALLEAEVKYQSLVEQIPAVVFLDAADETETTLYISPRIEELTGYTPDEWRADPDIWINNIHSEDRQRIAESDNKTHLHGEAFQDEYRFIRRDGRVIWIKEDTNLICDKHGKPLYWQGILIDITKEKEGEAALQSERDFALQVLNNMGQGLTVVDKHSRFEYVNPAYASMLGHAVEELLGKTPTDFTTASKQALLLEERNRRLQGIASTYETTLVHKDSHEVPVVITGVPRQQNGEINGAIAVITDLTVQKQTEQALERQVKELTALHAVATAEAESLSEDEIITKVTLAISQIYSEVCGILLLDATGHILTPHPSYYGADISNWQNGYPITEGITGRAVTTGKIIRIGDVTKEPGYIEIAAKVISELCVPIRVNERVIGVVNVESKSADTFTEHDEGFLITIASGLGTALEKLRLFNEEQRRAKELNTLYLATKSLTQSLEPTTIAEKLIAIINELLDYDSASIHVVDDEGKFLTALAISRKSQDPSRYNMAIEKLIYKQRPLGIGIIDWVIQNERSVRTGDAVNDSRYLEVVKGVQSELCVPLIARGRAIGAINVETVIPNAYSEADENILSALANSAAIALENAKLYQEALRASERRAVLHRISQDIVRFTQDSEQIYKSIHEAAGQLMSCDVFLISLRNTSNDENIYPYVMEDGTRYSLQNQPADEGLPGKVINSHESIILVNEKAIDSGEFPRFGSPKRVQSAVAVPMRIGHKTIGMISVQSYIPNSYGSEEQSLLEMLATHAAVALENARLFEAEKQRRQEAETLRETTNKLTSAVELDELFEIILVSLKKLVPYESASIELAQNEYYEIVAGSGLPANLIGRRYLVDITKWGDNDIPRQPIIIYDVQLDERFEKFEETNYIRGWMGIPLLTQGKLIGFLNLDSRTPGFYTNEYAALAQTFGNQAAIAIEKARLFQEQNRRSEIIESLANIANEIATTREVIPALEKITQRAFELLNASHVAIFLLQDDNVTLKSVTAHGTYRKELLAHTVKVGEGITGQVLINGKPEIVNHLVKDLRRIPLPGTPAEDAKLDTVMLAPLLLRGKAIGVINVWRLREQGLFNDTELNFLVSIANQASICIESGRLFQETKRQAQEAAAIAEVGRDISSTLQLNVVLERIASYAKDLMHAETSAVFLADESNSTLRAIAVIGLDADEIKNDPLKIGRGILGNIAYQKSGEFVNDTANDPRGITIQGTTVVPLENIMGVPILFHGQLTGLLAVWRTGEGQEFIVSELDFATRLAQQAAIALENARLFESERRRRQEAETLRQAASAISSTLDPDEVVTEILAALKQVISFDSGSVFFHEGHLLRLAMAKGFPNSDQLKNLTFSADDELFQIIKSTGRPLIIDDVSKDPRFKSWGISTNIRGWMAVPLITRGHVIGYITLDSHQPGTYNESIGETAMAFAHQAAAATDNARLYDETQRRLRELEIINRVSMSLRLTQSVDEMLSILLNEALLLMNTLNGSIWLYDSSSNTLVQRIARGTDAKLLQITLKPGEGIVGYVFTTGEKYISTEMKIDPLLSIGNKESMTPGLSGICIPIQSTVGPVGVLIAVIEKDRQIAEEINLLTILAEITGNAIHRAELFAQSQEQIHRLTTLRDIDAAIASSTDLRVTLNILMDHTLKHLKTDAVDIMLYHPELQSLTYLSSAGFNNPSPSRPLMRLGEGLAGQVVMKGGIEHVPDIRISNEVKRDPMLIREGFITYFGIPLIIKGQTKGVFEIFHRAPFTPSIEWTQFLQTLAGQAAIAIDNSQLFEHLQRSNQEVTQAYDTTLEGWARALELRDRETEGHTRRVTELTMQLARYMNIAEDELINIYRGVLLHDIGKMGVPDQILRKTGPLIDSEWVEMRKHPEYAYNLLKPIPYLRPALDIPYCHHEHWDGSGYPQGLKGEQIPLAARIFSIVDIWDALLSDRSYRKAWKEPRVIAYLKEISGTILDPKVVTEFFKMIGIQE